jgi:hypothetical protein
MDKESQAAIAVKLIRRGLLTPLEALEFLTRPKG